MRKCKSKRICYKTENLTYAKKKKIVQTNIIICLLYPKKYSVIPLMFDK